MGEQLSFVLPFILRLGTAVQLDSIQLSKMHLDRCESRKFLQALSLFVPICTGSLGSSIWDSEYRYANSRGPQQILVSYAHEFCPRLEETTLNLAGLDVTRFILLPIVEHYGMYRVSNESKALQALRHSGLDILKK